VPVSVVRTRWFGVIWMWLSYRHCHLSVCPWRAGTMRRCMLLGWRGFHCCVAQGLFVFWYQLGRRGTPLAVDSNEMAVGRQISDKLVIISRKWWAYGYNGRLAEKLHMSFVAFCLMTLSLLSNMSSTFLFCIDIVLTFFPLGLYNLAVQAVCLKHCSS